MKYWYLSSFAHAKEILGYTLWECKLAKKQKKQQQTQILYQQTIYTR